MNVIFIFECHPKISHYIYANIPKSENNQNPKHFWPKHFRLRDIQPAVAITKKSR